MKRNTVATIFVLSCFVACCLSLPLSEEDDDSGSIEIPAKFLEKKLQQQLRTNAIQKDYSSSSDHITLMNFIGKVLNTAQHRYKMNVERAKKRALLSKTLKEDAEKVLRDMENEV